MKKWYEENILDSTVQQQWKLTARSQIIDTGLRNIYYEIQFCNFIIGLCWLQEQRKLYQNIVRF